MAAEEEYPLGYEFGQKRPPLSVLIKSILDRYPDGQIFKVRKSEVIALNACTVIISPLP